MGSDFTDREMFDKYKKYIELRQKGLKAEAKQYLQLFVEAFSHEPVADKRRFIDFAFSAAYNANDFTLYLPFNLYDNYLKAEIEKWKIEDPDNPIPYKWSADFSDNKKALALSPNDQQILEIVGNRIINIVSMNQHELVAGFGYMNNPNDDVEKINNFLSYINNITDVQKRATTQHILNKLKQCATEWINQLSK